MTTPPWWREKVTIYYYYYNIKEYDNDKIWCFYITNEINFHKRKISAPRVGQSQTLIPFSVRVRFVCSELISSLTEPDSHSF